MSKHDRAILYGINNYRHISDLRGCKNDVENIERLLIEEFGFKSRNIVTRTDDDVVYDALEHDWKWLLKDVRPGARLVFHFSGHGSYVEDESGDEDDGVDEILCLYNMKFGNPRSYLMDDQIHEWTRELPEDVRLTMILDCCHSGTGTRQIRQRVRSGRSVSGEELPLVIDDGRTRSRSASNDEKPGDSRLKLARFVQPPDEVEERKIQFGRRKRIGKRSSGRLNHVRFSGCRDDQTSADAWIDGDFHGAFSYYLCDNIRASGDSVLHTDLIAKVRRSLEAEYSQIPQLAPKDVATRVFGGIEVDRQSPDVATGQAGDDALPSPVDIPQSADLGKLISLVEQMLKELRSAAGRQGGVASSSGSRGNRALVYVHGICWHDAGFSDKWFRALRSHLSTGLRQQLEANRHEVLWSRHVSSGDRGEELRNSSQQEVADEIRDVLLDRVDQSMELQMDRADSSLDRESMDRALFGIPGLDCVDDFVKYLLSNRIRSEVIDEFKKKVHPLLQNGVEVDVIAHSWGTVVTLEAMHQLQGQSLSGRVRNFFTVGSALSIRPIQRRLKFGAETGLKPAFVDRWVNIDARGDVVGGTLKRFPFSVDEEFLNCPAVTCPSGLFGPSPACAHRSYFESENVAVNREIFARFM